MIRSKPTLRGRDEGAVAVESAITLSLLLLLILGIIEFAFAFWQWNTMLLAVSQAGRYVMVNNGGPLAPSNCDTSCAQTKMQAILTSAAVCTSPAADQTCVSASLSTLNGTDGMTLTALYGFNFIALAGPFTISSGIWVPLD
jgi:Flp pilus assembly protein TadG